MHISLKHTRSEKRIDFQLDFILAERSTASFTLIEFEKNLNHLY